MTRPATTTPPPVVVDPAASPTVAGWRHRRTVIAAAVAVALVLTAIVSFQWGSAGGTAQPDPTASPEPSPVEALTTAEVYAALAPSVVTIEAMSAGRVTSTGTGVIVNADGVILTALHVVNGAGSLRVTYANGEPSTAAVLAADPANDIAALSVDTLPTVVVPATLGSSGRLAIGDGVVAIGNQLGLTSSATAGVVSGLNRGATGTDGSRLTGLIQFDAAVNPGSSGGPLVNGRGEVVAIVVALANPTSAGTFIGIGFAVPIGTAGGAGGGGRGPQQ